MSTHISFTFNSKTIICEPGQSIAAALIASEHREIRTTRFGKESRSIFCGIGVCFDCVVTIDEIANQRSCLVEAKDGMKVESSS